MKKADIRTAIQALEPNNAVCRDSRATRADLLAELRSAKRRRASEEAARATPCVMVWREEENEYYSWKFLVGNEAQCPLQHGADLPMPGSIHPDVCGNPLRVSKMTSGLEIFCGDLCVRDEFDARRVYSTQSGSSVTYKRVEGDLVVLWSYKHGNEIALGAKVQLTRLNRKAQPTVQSKKRKTQKVVASWLISQQPDITGSELTELLKEAFPSHTVSARHGPHYQSLSRKGKLPEPPDEDPRNW